MKRFTMLLVFLILSVFMFSQETVRLTNGEWPPYMGENIRENGLMSHIVKEALAIEGYKVEYSFFPWKRSYELAKTGEWDGTVGWKKNAEREKDFYFSDPILSVKEVFFHREDLNFDWTDYEELKKYKIGISIGYSYGYDFDSMKDKLNVEETTEDLANLRKLQGKRIDLFPCALEVGYFLIKQNFKGNEAKNLINHPKSINTAEYNLILTKDNPGNREIIIIFDRGLKKLKSSKKFDKLVADAIKGKYQ